MAVYRRGTHRSQFDGSALQGENCTPTSAANGAREATDGKYDHSGGFVRALVARSEETNPATPGWSLGDADLAMRRAGIPFTIGSGGWAGVVAARADGHGIILQGDSDQFTTGCSAAFNGDHCVYIHPENSSRDGVVYWLLGDPICGDWRWEKASVLRNYAEKFSASIKYGIFDTPVRRLEEPVMAQAPHTDENPSLIDIAVGATLYDIDGKTVVGKTSTAYVGRFSPFGIADGRAVYVGAWATGRVVRFVKQFSNLRPVPDATPFSQTDVDNAVTKEKSRLRTLLGL